MNAHRRLAFCLALALAAPLAAQDAAQPPKMTPEQQAMMDAWVAAGKPGSEHEQLKGMVGRWDAATSMWMDPSAPPEQSKGTEVSEAIYGGRYVRSTFNGNWAGEAFEGTAISGYDNVRKKYHVTWFDSMSTAIYTAYVDYDAATKSYTYHGEMPDPAAGGAMIKVRQVVRVDSPDAHTMTWYETRAGAPEAKTMEIVYTRAK